MTNIDTIREDIISSLFTNGFGQKAQRIMLVLPDGRNGGGYSEDAVRLIITAALSTIDRDAKPQEPSEDAATLVRGWWIEWMDSTGPDSIHEVCAQKLAALITAHDDATRRECADRAFDYIHSTLAKGLGYDDYNLRAAILDTKPIAGGIMIQAEKIEFQNMPPIRVGGMFNGYEVSKIEVYHIEYEDHSELYVVPYDGIRELGKVWNVPAIITYKRPTP